MKKTRLFSVFILFLFISTFVDANLNVTINLIEENEGSFRDLNNQELTLTNYFNTGEKIMNQLKSSDISSFSLDKELFCYNGCNIVPKRIISIVT